MYSISTSEVEDRVTKQGLLYAVSKQPEEFVTRMTQYVYPILDGCDHGRLMYYYSLLEGCLPQSSSDKTTISPETHVKLLKKIKPAAKGQSVSAVRPISFPPHSLILRGNSSEFTGCCIGGWGEEVQVVLIVEEMFQLLICFIQRKGNSFEKRKGKCFLLPLYFSPSWYNLLIIFPWSAELFRIWGIISNYNFSSMNKVIYIYGTYLWSKNKTQQSENQCKYQLVNLLDFFLSLAYFSICAESFDWIVFTETLYKISTLFLDIFDYVSGLDYKKLLDGKQRPLDVIRPVLNSGNVHVLAKLAPKIPDQVSISNTMNSRQMVTHSPCILTWKLFRVPTVMEIQEILKFEIIMEKSWIFVFFQEVMEN